MPKGESQPERTCNTRQVGGVDGQGQFVNIEVIAGPVGLEADLQYIPGAPFQCQSLSCIRTCSTGRGGVVRWHIQQNVCCLWRKSLASQV